MKQKDYFFQPKSYGSVNQQVYKPNPKVQDYQYNYEQFESPEVVDEKIYQNYEQKMYTKQQYYPNQSFQSVPEARYFVLKSLDEDNIHKSIKYKIWCSTMKGNQKLQKVFREAEGKYPIYLFFRFNVYKASMDLAGFWEFVKWFQMWIMTQILITGLKMRNGADFSWSSGSLSRIFQINCLRTSLTSRLLK